MLKLTRIHITQTNTPIHFKNPHSQPLQLSRSLTYTPLSSKFLNLFIIKQLIVSGPRCKSYVIAVRSCTVIK